MGEEEMIRIQYEAIKKFSCGDNYLVFKIINELGRTMREFIESSHPNEITCDQLCAVIQDATRNWKDLPHSLERRNYHV